MALVLVVDDTEVNRDLARTVLRLHGHEVLEAEDGATALQLIRDEPIDVAVLDVLMPGMDGYELVREIRADPRTAPVRVIFYTANYLEEEALPIARAVGVTRVVMKTGDTTELTAAIDDVLAEAPTTAAPITDAAYGREHLRVLNAKLLAKIDELEQKARLHQLVDATVSVGNDLSLSATLDRIARAARSLVGSRHAVVRLTGEDGRPGSRAWSSADPLAAAEPDEPIIDGEPAFSVAIEFDGQHEGWLELDGRQAGGRYTADDEDLVVSLAAAAGRAITNAQRYERARRREAWLSASIEVTSALLSAEPADTLDLVARGARRVTDAAAVWIVVPAGDDAVLVAACDGEAGGLRDQVLPQEKTGIYLATVATGAPVLVDDLTSDQRALMDAVDGLGIGPMLAVPLLANGEHLGALFIGNAVGAASFSNTDITMASAFAAHAALALEFGRAADDRQRLLLFEDRDRIARDLHDIVIQRVFAAGLRLEGIRPGLTGRSAATVASTIDELDQTISDIRTAIFSLRTTPDDGASLRSALLETIAASAEVLGFTPQLRIEGPVDAAVPTDVHHDILATLREALSNVAKHAQASVVQVLVRAREGQFLLRVSDDGRGLPTNRHESGLANLAARAEDLGGALSLDRGLDGRGLVLSWRVPIS